VTTGEAGVKRGSREGFNGEGWDRRAT